MARVITKELAEKIAVKLGAVYCDTGAHKMAFIYHEGKLVASFGIRRGSNKEQGHDHVPGEVNLSTGKAKRLGQCPMSKEQWIEEMRAKRLLS